jgi:hypothetical protein
VFRNGTDARGKCAALDEALEEQAAAHFVFEVASVNR